LFHFYYIYYEKFCRHIPVNETEIKLMVFGCVILLQCHDYKS